MNAYWLFESSTHTNHYLVIIKDCTEADGEEALGFLFISLSFVLRVLSGSRIDSHRLTSLSHFEAAVDSSLEVSSRRFFLMSFYSIFIPSALSPLPTPLPFFSFDSEFSNQNTLYPFLNRLVGQPSEQSPWSQALDSLPAIRRWSCMRLATRGVQKVWDTTYPCIAGALCALASRDIVEITQVGYWIRACFFIGFRWGRM